MCVGGCEGGRGVDQCGVRICPMYPSLKIIFPTAYQSLYMCCVLCFVASMLLCVQTATHQSLLKFLYLIVYNGPAQRCTVMAGDELVREMPE